MEVFISVVDLMTALIKLITIYLLIKQIKR